MTYLMGMEKFTDLSARIPVGVGVVKFDMDAGHEVGRLRFDAGTHALCGGESVFVQRVDAESEDDGYLVTIVNGKARDEWSALVVYDARTMNHEPVALVRAPQRVPLGFHAIHVPLERLRGLRATAA